MRIGLVHDPDLVNSNYRCYQPLQVLSRKGHEIVASTRGEPQPGFEALRRCDAVLVHRFLDDPLRRDLRRLRAEGVGVVWDNDDDITNVPRENPSRQAYGGVNRSRIVAALSDMLALADVATTPSEVLAEQFRAAGAADVRVLENYLPVEFGRAKPVKHDGFTVVWLAGLEHQLDYQQLRLKETLERLLDAHPQIRVLSIGLACGIRSDRYTHLKLVEFLELASTMAHCDLGIAPLADIPWNRARSNVKLKEYGAAGLPWLASPVGPYLGMGEKQGGLLVPEGGWHDAIEQLALDARRRRKLAKHATRWARDQSVDKHAHLWERALTDAAAGARRQVGAAATR